MATAWLLSAERSAIAEAQANLNAAQGRNRVGLATIADVLQAKTALSQEQLNLETTQGNLQAARGGLAAALGLPANLPFDLQPLTEPLPVRTLALSVDSVISEALRSRPTCRLREPKPRRRRSPFASPNPPSFHRYR